MSTVSRTNQVLYFARLSLNAADGAQDLQLKRYHEECALFHIYSAAVSFANELVTQYGLMSFDDLTELLSRADLPSEVRELSLLFKDSNSWLAAIVKQYKRLILTGIESLTHTSGLILSQSDFSSLFRNWLIELEKVVQRMREQYQEN